MAGRGAGAGAGAVPSSCRVDDVELYESPDDRTEDWDSGVPT